jgi:mannose-6-phosphate isomerase-like protein (cupin superfamily)
MPRVSKESTEKTQDYGPVLDRCSTFEGYTINFVTFREDSDITEILASLDEKKCVCPHWGYVFSGRVSVTYENGREETIEPGDAFYMPAGHTSWRAEAGTELLQFSPSDLLAEVDAAIFAAMQARTQ